MTNKLYDVVEFIYNRDVKKFLKLTTHHYNIPKSLAYGLKKQLEAQRNSIKLKIGQRLNLITVVSNGTYQYTNELKKRKKKEEEVT
jgi:hypothetical protein